MRALRLLPGTDVRPFLKQWCHDERIDAAAIVSAVGSLSRVHLRFADRPSGTSLSGKHEVLSLTGTLGANGLHLHALVADADGRCFGGHLLDGNEVYTTLELVIALLPDHRFLREPDPRTGFRELRVERLD